AGFFVPGFSSGFPMGRFQATLGISSLARASGRNSDANTSRRNNPRRKDIKPPDIKRAARRLPGVQRKTYRVRGMLHNNDILRKRERGPRLPLRSKALLTEKTQFSACG